MYSGGGRGENQQSVGHAVILLDWFSKNNTPPQSVLHLAHTEGVCACAKHGRELGVCEYSFSSITDGHVSDCLQ